MARMLCAVKKTTQHRALPRQRQRKGQRSGSFSAEGTPAPAVPIPGCPGTAAPRSFTLGLANTRGHRAPCPQLGTEVVLPRLTSADRTVQGAKWLAGRPLPGQALSKFSPR